MITSANSPVTSDQPSMQFKRFPTASWIFFSSVCLLLVLSISSQSFWIDEAYTASLAQQPTLSSWWGELYAYKFSDLQMPLYSLWIWGCEKVFGSSEVALRAVNLLWFVPALLVLFRSLAGRRSLQIAALLVAAFSPFAWFYLNEARSYTMQMSASLFLYAVIYHWHQNRESNVGERWWVLGFAVGLILLCGSSLLSMIFAAIPILAITALLPKQRLMKLVRDHRFIWVGTFLVLLSLGLYYLWTLRIGARATNLATTDWKNPLFICYELLGFAGLGPSRLEIREGGFGVFKPYGFALTFYAGTVAVLLLMSIGHLSCRIRSWRLFGVIFSVAAPICFVLVASNIQNFRVLGRHFAALAPFAFFLLAFGVMAAWQRGKAGKTLVVVFCALYLTSTLSLRFGLRHQKDDYRSASLLANTALENGRKVWWSADDSAARYYKVPLSDDPQGGKALLVRNPPVNSLGSNDPDLVIASKPDVYDAQNALRKFLANSGYAKKTNFPAFIVWEKPVN